MELVIDPSGRIRCLYDEAIDLTTLGAAAITRASHLEPDADGAWWADLSPVDGPLLGPFMQRSAGLAAEQVWLREHWLSRKDDLDTLAWENHNGFDDPLPIADQADPGRRGADPS